jgi:hypothetical protein
MAATATQRLIEQHPLLPPPGKGERKEAWSQEWINAISPTESKTTAWHLKKLKELVGEFDFSRMDTITLLNMWVDEGSNTTINYIGPRLKLSAAICYHSRGARFEWYRRFQMRFLKWTSLQVRERDRQLQQAE